MVKEAIKTIFDKNYNLNHKTNEFKLLTLNVIYSNFDLMMWNYCHKINKVYFVQFQKIRKFLD